MASTAHGAATASRAALTVQRLPGLELGPGAGVLAQEARQGAQQVAEVGAADLAGDAQALDEPVADGVAQPVLEPVEAVVEAPGEPVVVRERPERLAQLLRARVPSWDSASGSAIPARTPEVMLSTASGHRSRSRARRRRARARTTADREVGGHRREARRDRQHAHRRLHQGEHEQEGDDAGAEQRCARDRPWKPAWTISSDSRSSGPARRVRGTGRSGGTQQLHQTRNSPSPSRSPSSRPVMPTAWASSADRS